MQKKRDHPDRFLFVYGRFEIGVNDTKEDNTSNSKTNDLFWSGLGATSCSPRFSFPKSVNRVMGGGLMIQLFDVVKCYSIRIVVRNYLTKRTSHGTVSGHVFRQNEKTQNASENGLHVKGPVCDDGTY